MKKLISILSLVLIVFFMALTLNTVKAEEIGDISVDIRATFDNYNDVELVTEKQVYGSTINVDANVGALTDYEFAFWVVDGLVDHEKPASTSFVVTNNLEAVAVFHPVNTYVVVFVDHSGKLIDAQYEDYAIPSELPNKVNYEHDGWEIVTGSSDLSDVTENTVHRLKYKLADGVTKITINEDEYAFNEIVTLKLPEGMTHWEEDGEVVAYGDYTFSALYDRTLVANSGVTEETLVTFKELNNYRDGYKTFLGQVNLAGSNTLLELGLEVDGVLQKAKQVNPHTNEFLISVPDATRAEWDTVRAYAIYKDGDEYVTIYDRKIIPGMIYVDFEDADLPSSYSDGLFVQGGITFTYGHSRDEENFPIDGKGLMLRYSSTSYIEFTIPNGLSYLQFEYRKAYTGGSDRELELIVNNTQVETTGKFGGGSGAQDNIYTFEYEPEAELTGKTTIKIKNVGNASSNNQSVIDNLYIFDKDTIATRYDVTFEVDSEYYQVIKVLDGKLVKEATAPVKEGYTFIEWKLDGVKYNFDTPVTDDITLVAKYEMNKYSLTLPVGGVTSNKTSPIEHGTKVTLNITVPEGKVLDKLIVNEADVSDEVINNQYTFNILEDTIVDVIFLDDDLEEFTVTLDLDYDDQTITEKVLDGLTLNEPDDPERTGYEFIEWQLDGIKYDFNTPVTKDITLVAIWNKLKVYDYIEDFEGQISLPSSYNDGSFTGNSDLLFIYNNSRNQENYAIEGTGLMFPTNTSYLEFILPNGFTEIYFEYRKAFTGNNNREIQIVINESVAATTGSSNLGIGGQTTIHKFEYIPETPVIGPVKIRLQNNGAHIVIDNLKWIEFEAATSYTVEFNTGGGSFISNQLVVEGNKVVKPADPNWPGYEFKGWQLNDVDYDFDDVVTSDITLVAIWEKIEITESTKVKLEYESGGGTKNMRDDTNEAELFGMSSEIFSVVGIKNKPTNNVGLNNAGNIRLYYGSDGNGNGNSLSIEINGDYVITEISIKFLKAKDNGADAKIILGDITANNTTKEDITNKTITFNDLDIANFSIQNINEVNVQLWIEYIEITFEPVNP